MGGNASPYVRGQDLPLLKKAAEAAAVTLAGEPIRGSELADDVRSLVGRGSPPDLGFDEQASYSRNISAAGFAAFFAVWGFTKDYMTATQSVVAALLMISSCGTFVLWEVYRMVSAANELHMLTQAARSPDERWVAELLRWHADAGRRQEARVRRWRKQLIFSLSTGMLAVGFLIWGLCVALATQLLS